MVRIGHLTWMIALLSLIALAGCQGTSLSLKSVLPADMQASAHFRRGDFEAAIVQWQEALQIQRILRNRGGIAKIKLEIGMAYLELDNIRAAQHTFGEALAIAQGMQQTARIAGRSRLVVQTNVSTGKRLESLALMHLGTALVKREQYPKALKILNRAADMRQLNEMEKHYGRLLMNYGIVYQGLGQYRRALRDFQDALAIFKKKREKYSESLIYVHTGEIRRTLGQSERAQQDYQTALALARDTGRASLEVRALSLLGQLHTIEGEYTAARERFDQALAICLAKGLSTKITDLFAGDMAFETGALSQARRMYTRHHDHIRLGAVDLAEGHFRAAHGRFTVALEKRVGTYRHAQRFAAYMGLGRAEEAMGQNARAEQNYRLALALVDELHETLPLAQKGHFLAAETVGFSHLDPYEGLVRVLLRSQRFTAAFYYSEHTKARQFTESVARRHGRLQHRLPVDMAVKVRVLERELETLYHRRDDVLAGAQNNTVEHVRRQIQDKRKERRAFIERIWQQYPEYASLWYPRPQRAREIPLKTDEYLLAYEVTETLTAAWLLHRGKVVKTTLIPITRTTLETRVQMYRASLQAVSLADLNRFDADAGYQLYTLLLHEMLRHVPADRQLVIVPDEVLGQLPFEALIAKRPTHVLTGQGPHGAYPRRVRYVGDTHAISYTQSATSLAILRRLHQPSAAAKSMLIVADPIFDASDARQQLATDRVTVASPDVKVNGLNPMRTVESTGNWRLYRLPETAKMAASLRLMFGPDVTVLQGRDATTANLRRQSLSHYRYLVFATHGIFSHPSIQLREPSLVMSQVGHSAPGDGFLTMSDIANLRLDAQVSALIACDTGRGRYVRGEGVLGLGRAFQFAGSRSVLASLWSVAESATVQLTERFFAHLKVGLGPQDALRQARRDIRQDGYEHPFYWASFIHISG